MRPAREAKIIARHFGAQTYWARILPVLSGRLSFFLLRHVSCPYRTRLLQHLMIPALKCRAIFDASLGDAEWQTPAPSAAAGQIHASQP